MRHEVKNSVGRSRSSVICNSFSMAFGLRLQCAENLIVNVPSLQEDENRFRRKSSAQQHAKNARRFALILRLLQPLAIEELACELLFANILISLGDRLVYDISMNTLCF